MNDTPRVTVPVEPTPEMIEAGAGKKGVSAYRAMLSAAPAPEGGEVSIWSDARNVFVRYAELFAMTERYEEASAIADKAAREIEALATRAPAEAGEVSAAIQRVNAVADGGDVTDVYGAESFAHPNHTFRGDLRAILALRAQPPAREDAQPVAWPEKWSGPCTVGNMIANLRTLPPEMPIYTAYHIPMGDCPSLLKVKLPTLSRERVDGNDIKTGNESIPYSAVIWTQPRDFTEATHPAPDALRVAMEALEYVKQETADFAEAWEIAEVCDEKITALQAEQKGGAA